MSKQTVRTKKVTNKEIAEAGAQAYKLGREFGDFRDWYFSKRFPLRCELDSKILEEIYNQGVESKVKENICINRLCIFIRGDANTGKTYTSEETLRAMNYKRIHEPIWLGSGKFSDLQTDHQAILIDTLSDGKDMSYLLKFCCDKPVKISRSKKDHRYFTGEVVIVTGVFTFDEWAKHCKFNKEQTEYIKSKFYICECKENMQIKCISAADYGTKEQQQERLGKFMDFAQLYNRLILNYKKTDSLNRFYKMNEGNRDPRKTHEILNKLRCHKVCSKTFKVKSNTVRLKRGKLLWKQKEN